MAAVDRVREEEPCWRLAKLHEIWVKAAISRMFVAAHSRVPANLLSRWGGASQSSQLSDEGGAVSAMSYTDVPQGGVFHFLVRNLPVTVVIIMVMLSDDLVIVVAPFDQRNRAFKYKLGSLL